MVLPAAIVGLRSLKHRLEALRNMMGGRIDSLLNTRESNTYTNTHTQTHTEDLQV